MRERLMAALRVIGWFGRRNSGDEAFRVVHSLLLPERELAWLVPGTGFEEGRDFDDSLVLVSAGDIVSPFYFDQIPPEARIVVYGVGLGWLEQLETLQAVRDRIVAVWVRNEGDVESIRALGIDAHYSPDIAVLLHRLLPPNEKVAPAGRKKAIVTVTDSPRSDALRRNDSAKFLEAQVFANQLAAAVDYVAQYYDVEFVPFSFDRNDYDLAAIHDVIPRMKSHQAVGVLERELAPLEAIEHFRSADLVISTKFHGAIYAIMNHTPFILSSNTRKARLLCEENGLREVFLPPVEFHGAAFKRALVFAERPETRQLIVDISHRMIETAEAEAGRFRATVLGHATAEQHRAAA
jgi:polysaccharide pyruvyl transferase WcaK-like protein